MKVVGSSRPIHDAEGKAAGYTQYAGDIMLPNMGHACLITSEIPHGYVREIRTEKALAVDGVYGVFHCFNTTQRAYNRYRSQATQDELKTEERVFNEYVRFVGDRVGAVVACDLDTARKAARLVEIEYETLPSAVTFEEALAGENLLPGELAVVDEFRAHAGEAYGQGEDIVEIHSDSDFPRLHHVTMETHSCVADYDAYQQTLCIYSPNQSSFGIRTVVADYLEMPYHKVRVVKTTMGGSFGAKQEWITEPVAALLAKELGRPVKLVFTRAQSMLCAVVRAPMRAQVKSTFTPDGVVRSMDVDMQMDAGAYIGSSSDYMRAFYGKFFRCYRIPKVDYHVRLVSSNTPVSGSYRGWSAPEAAIILEHHMNVAAQQLHIDPITLRLKNVMLPGDTDEKIGLPIEEIRIREALMQGRDSFRWEEKKAEDAAFNAGGDRYRRGVGIACGGHGNTYYPRHKDFAGADLRLNEDGTIQANISLHDHGCGTVTAFTMILSEALDIAEERIRVTEADTAVTPYDFGCYASRTVFVIGRAAYEAAQRMREALVSAVAEIEDVPEETLYLASGEVRSKEDEQLCYDFREIARQGILKLRRQITVQAQFANNTNPGVTGAHFVHVEVDTYTGFTKIMDYLAVHDIGQPINRAMCVAQIQGAAQMGCGAALREKITVLPNGHCVDSLSKYHVFLAPDLPNIRVELITDGLSQEGPYGAKSIGEIAYVPSAPAVCAAVNSALGTSIGDLPLDPDCILKYFAKEREG